MSLAQITEKIQKDAKAEAQKILDKAKKQEEEIRQEAEAEVKKLEEAAAARFDAERPEIFRRREIVARLDVNKLKLDAQRRLIKDVFDGTLRKLRELGKDKYSALCKGMLKKAHPKGSEVLTVAKGEKVIDKGWLDSVNSELGTKITMSDKKGDFSGGFVLSDGRIDINCSFEMLVQVAQEQMETEVVKRLFPS